MSAHGTGRWIKNNNIYLEISFPNRKAYTDPCGWWAICSESICKCAFD
jgi:hypothetical protein